MKELRSLLVEDSNMLGPGTDLIISLVSVLVMIIAIYRVKNEVSITQVQEHQTKVVNLIANNNLIQGDSMLVFDTLHAINENISIEHDNYRQIITFGGGALFQTGGTKLDDLDTVAVKAVGLALQEQIKYIAEIQVHGHADASPITKFPEKCDVDYYETNTELAFHRAKNVFNYLSNKTNISPDNTLMSIASYGEYKPVTRKMGEEWNEAKTKNANNTGEVMKQNRRIELLIVYE